VRNKEQLIKMAESQARKMWNVVGDVYVIDISPYNAELDCYTVIVEFDDGR
jgi:hypothetical protein